MKPLHLHIQAFGPFAEAVDIDFTAFGENALFLINGPTGAGKSTLLDALCFALYGETTGGNREREATSMRCDQASDDLETRIHLDFLLGDTVYHLERTPTQTVAKKRGEGTTTRQTDAHVWKVPAKDWTGEFNEEEADYLSLKGVREVNDWVLDLTGLSAEQFRQVMVLPQGKFRELLLASSSEREAIFSQLFQTHIYSAIETRLKDKANTIKRDRERMADKLSAYLQSAEAESPAELEAQIQALAPRVSEAKALLDAATRAATDAQRRLDAGQALKQQFEQLAQARNDLATLEGQGDAIRALDTDIQRARQAQTLVPAFEVQEQRREQVRREHSALERVTADCERLTQEVREAEARRKAAEADWRQLDTLKTERTTLEGHRDRLAELTQARQRETEASQAAEHASQAYDAFNQRREALKRERQTLESRQAELQADLKPQAERQQQRANLERYGKLKRVWQDADTEAKRLEQALKMLDQRLVDANTRFEQLKNHATRLEIRWHQGQAAELAATLVDGEPCPVCGSEAHPRPAAADGDDRVTREAVAEARQQQDAQWREVTQLQTERAEQTQAMRHARQRADDQLPELGDYIDWTLDDLRDEYRRLDQACKTLDQTARQLEDTGKRLTDVRGQLDDLDRQEADHRKRRDTALADQASASQAVRSLEQAVPEQWRVPDTLETRLRELNRRIDTIQQTYEQAQSRHTELSEALAGKQASRTDLSNRLDRAKQESEDAQSHWADALNRSDFDSKAAFRQARLDEDAIGERQARIDTYHQQRSERIGVIDSLTGSLKDQTEPDLDQLQQHLNAATQEQKVATDAFEQLRFEHTTKEKALKNLGDARKALDELDHQYGLYGTLADVASGANGQRINLQRFVLSVLLDDVLIEATQRLSRMSKGRYTLLRKRDRTKGNRASGLDLDVEDAYTGKTRPVNTLSGGESFMAALSLALGLSDVVQAYAGGIRLDTLFIDEGFGSLDPDALDLAIETLMDLRANGRTVGIISHVTELKEQMPQRIDVVSDQQGSKVKVVA
ncbi:AAA family ATPase [Saccharospirillum salsuginis]|uniref:Nuclease SbcCD subunit C n=1 Tax=Saccharospirillum salsuginis TaxID=418750 RepID=A0A918K9S3_9GAMM|nr:SMC family ATPase [Saccharospirillum salsuginis]GGX55367.1 nuclease SbcCD subunit C [Saccharospirillum salsuginis]